MFMTIYITVLIMNTVGALTLIFNSETHADDELAFWLLIMSFIPGINFFSTVIIALGMTVVIDDIRKKKGFDKEIANEFHECKNCTMLSRFAYIKGDVCPSCEEKSTFQLSKDKKFKGSKNIFFHEKVRTLKQFNKIINKKPEKLNAENLVLQQEETYQKILQQKLKKKEVKG